MFPWNSLDYFSLCIKFRRITRTRFAIRKKTQYSTIIRGWISNQIRGYNSTRVIFESERIRVWTMIFEQVQTVLVFVLRLNMIFGFQYRASTRLRLQTFKIRLENESQVGTPLRLNLLCIASSITGNLGWDSPTSYYQFYLLAEFFIWKELAKE